MSTAQSPSVPTKTVYLGMPGYGEQTAGAGRALWNAVSSTPAKVHVQYQQGSLLAANFNALWCWALNGDRNEGVDYFAMLHSDVEPQDGWLEILIDELETHDLDVLGTAVPIKDPNGITSLALERADGDTWRPLCRLSLREVHNLPPTFTSEDVGHNLLLNTGCWVCRFDSKWARKVHFTINDAIAQDPSGEYRPLVEPEDWYFSRLCHEMGLKIGATRKVRISHAGKSHWGNEKPWGQDFDRAYLSESALPQPETPAGFVFPEDVDGWLTSFEGAALAEFADGQDVLEIGSYCGRSTICLAQTARSVVSVDPHHGEATPEPRETLSAIRQNLESRGLAEQVELFVGTSDDFHNQFPLRRFSRIFIDGDHSADAVRRDLEIATAHLADGGVICCHDYRTMPGEHDGGWDPGVTQAIDEFVACGAEILGRRGTLAVIRPPAIELAEARS